MTSLDRSTKVAITTEELSPGVPLWGPNQIITSIPSGETSVALENLIAGRTYYMRTWTEDMFGNKSPYRENIIITPPDQTIPAKPTGLSLTASDNGFQASWSPVADIDLAEYDFAYANDDGTGTGPGHNTFTVVKTRATQFWVDQVHAQKTWCKVRSRDFSGNASDYSSLVSTTPVRTVPLTVSANGYLDQGSPMRAYVNVPVDVTNVVTADIKLAFRQFMAPASSAATSGTLTSASSGTLTSASGGGTSGGGGGNHSHTWAEWTSNTPSGTATNQKHQDGAHSTNQFNLVAEGSGNNFATSTTSTHTHTCVSHTHDVAGHTHDVAGHTHSLVYGTFEETYPVSHSVKVAVYKYNAVTLVWDLLHTSTSQTADLVSLPFATWINGPGDYRIEVLSDAGTPQGGRLGCDLFGTLTVVL